LALNHSINEWEWWGANNSTNALFEVIDVREFAKTLLAVLATVTISLLMIIPITYSWYYQVEHGGHPWLFIAGLATLYYCLMLAINQTVTKILGNES